MEILQLLEATTLANKELKIIKLKLLGLQTTEKAYLKKSTEEILIEEIDLLRMTYNCFAVDAKLNEIPTLDREVIELTYRLINNEIDRFKANPDYYEINAELYIKSKIPYTQKQGQTKD